MVALALILPGARNPFTRLLVRRDGEGRP
jgi:hypothetical protein